MGNFNRDRRGGGRSFGRRDFGNRGFDRGRDRGFGRGSDHPMYKATCSNCGKECQVPFQPTNGKPVYCSDCFEKMGHGGQDSRRPGRSEFRPQGASFDQSKIQLDAINSKLDKILNILQPKVEVPAEPQTEKTEAVEAVKEEKPKKVKKTAKKKASTKKK